MAENITTIQDKNELTFDEIVTDNVANLLYMIHGTGSDRDKKVNLETIKQYFEENSGSITIKSGSITVKLSGAGGTQTLTINHNGIVYTSSFSGSTITKKIDFEGTGSELSSLTLGTLSGSIPDGNSHKLDIDTNVVIGSENNKKKLTLNGNMVIDGRVMTNLKVGSSEVLCNLEVEGNARAKTVYANAVHADEIKPKTVGGNVNFGNTPIAAVNAPYSIFAVDNNTDNISWSETSEWVGAGQQKLLYNTTSHDIRLFAYQADNASATSEVLDAFTIPPHRFVRALCSGQTTTVDDSTYYVFFIEAGALHDAAPSA